MAIDIATVLGEDFQTHSALNGWVVCGAPYRERYKTPTKVDCPDCQTLIIMALTDNARADPVFAAKLADIMREVIDEDQALGN